MLKIGIATPKKAMKIRYIQKTGTSPSATVHAPIMRADSIIVYILFLKPPQAAITPPPAIIPTEKAISIAVSRHTSSPKVRATCNGVKKAAGAINTKNTEKNKKNFFRKA
ncbi:hypothetical protein D3C81_1509260 [compost metagenome]